MNCPTARNGKEFLNLDAKLCHAEGPSDVRFFKAEDHTVGSETEYATCGLTEGPCVSKHMYEG